MHRSSFGFILALAAAPLVGCDGSDVVNKAAAQAGTTQPGAHAPAKNVSAASSARAESHAELVARGQQLVTLGGCGDCHTPMRFEPKLGMPVPDTSRAYSGHPQGAPEPAATPGQGDQAVIGATFTSFRLPFGVVYARNLTPDKKTGLGNWSEQDFIATMRTGHRQGSGRALLPPMPWQNLAHQPDAQLQAMFAYLQSLPAIENAVPDPSVPPQVIETFAKTYASMANAH